MTAQVTEPAASAEESVRRPAGGSVWLVVYGDTVHAFDESDESIAQALYTVGVGATGEGDITKVSADTWAKVRPALRGHVRIRDHTTGQKCPVGQG